MKDFFSSWKYRLTSFLALTAFTGYALLDTFVIPRSYTEGTVQQSVALNTEGTVEVDKSVFETAKGTGANAENLGKSEEDASETGNSSESNIDNAYGTENVSESNTEAASEKHHRKNRPERIEVSSTSKAEEAVSTTIDTVSSDEVIGTYTDSVKTITLSEYRANDTSIYVADVHLLGDATELDESAYSASDLIQTAFADDTYGKNLKEATSVTAEENDAILAINGDFYGAQNDGYVIRNGALYRSTSGGNEDLAILADGSFEIFSENDLSAEEVLAAGAVDVLSFGPGLVENSEIAVTKDEEVGKAMASNPRTAIGILEDGHYVFVVTDGRTEESEGLTLYQLAEFMQSLGCTSAYNLDGGGSSTLYFNGEIINKPTTGGNNIKERSVSDIVYLGKAEDSATEST
ncbi:Predicted protein [Oribacterium sp. KHPX15]|uniref:phosphodiester glycosidase family protein n=1 Tax=Oribacterium sp. KHPX15 TaxID=1855342 RepID=UPI000894E97E|nr:phosphodiester glycosidase family protein [Oribacterium sp. KHPX15]SEA52843.1 Predicted protein [Oribacterium sp. KHPX15]